jgi:ELWxxDGT repeat protein
LSQPVLSTDNVLLSYTDPTSGNDAAAVQDAAGNDAASVTGFAVQNNTAQLHGKAPWTLLVPTSKGVFASDGTADGSRLIATQSGYPRVAANADHSAAVVIDWKYDSTTQKGDYFALGLDGSGNAPTVLAHGLASSLPRVFGKEIVVTNSGDVTTSGMVTDGTVAGTHLAATLPSGWIDTTHQTIWSSSFSDPYGYELYVTRISAAGAVTSMVKDILPGSGSGFVNATGSLLLPNGKLVFVGNDLAGGYEPWVSDGTEAGTMQLADLQPGANTAYPQLLAVFGSLAALSSVAYKPDDPTVSLGRELVITDGTAAGTHVLDIAPGGDSSNPQVVGAAGSTLYFTANALTGGLPTRALFSTDGTSSTRLADVTDTVTLLGQVGNKTFLSISDATHGAELWAVDGNGTLGLVKDILPGTGSGLSGAISPLVVGNELVFQAYVSATTRSLFMSDGTADGTVELGAATTKTQQAGHLLVYADGTNVYGLDGAAVAPQPVQLVTGSIGYAQMQADADQVFFEMANGDLYATDGTAGGTAALGHSVSTFKVVGENALYFVEQVTGGTGYSLNYSDGTVAGTYFVSYVDADFASHLGDGVVVHTVGVPPTQH